MAPVAWPSISKVEITDSIMMVPVLGLPGAVWCHMILALCAGHAWRGLAPFGLPGAVLVYTWAPGVGSIVAWLKGQVTDEAATIKWSVSIRTDTCRWPIFIADSVTFPLVLVAHLLIPGTEVESWLRLRFVSTGNLTLACASWWWVILGVLGVAPSGPVVNC